MRVKIFHRLIVKKLVGEKNRGYREKKIDHLPRRSEKKYATAKSLERKLFMGVLLYLQGEDTLQNTYKCCDKNFE